MKRDQLYKWIRKHKVAIAIVVGIIVLTICLAITHNYFGLPDWDKLDKSKLIHFAENLASGKDNTQTIKEWLIGTANTYAEGWIKESAGKIYDYLKDNVDWGEIFPLIVLYGIIILLILEVIRRAISPFFDEKRAPFNWKLDTKIVSKILKPESGKSLTEYLGDKLFQTVKKKIPGAVDKAATIVGEEIEKALVTSNAYSKQPSIEKIFLKKFKTELAEENLLFLIDRISPGDHFARFWALVCKELANENIPIDHFYFSSDPRVCFDPSTDECVTINELSKRYSQSCLIVVSDSRLHIQPDGQELKQRSLDFEKWQSRILLNTRNYHTWDKREGLLEKTKLFHLLPAKISSLNYITEILNVEEFQFPIKDHEGEHLIDYEEDILDGQNLDKYFSNTYSKTARKGEESVEKPQPVLDWIQSCAIPRQLDFQLSLELGKASFDRVEGSELTPEVILSVFQLPWFRKGVIPEQIRVLIAKKFDAESSKVAQAIRKVLKMKIPKWSQPKDSQAADALSETKQINDIKVTDAEPDKYTRQQVRKELNRIYDQGLPPDGILEMTEGFPNKYSKNLSSGVRSFLFNHGYSGLGLSRKLRNLLHSLLAALIVFLLFCLIIWLSRPLAEKPAPDCPPCDYRCIPITKVIGATATCQKKITLTGTEDKPLLAHITGVEDDCCTPIDARGSNVQLMIGEDSISWSSGDSIPDLTELSHGQTLRMLIKGQIDITLSDSAALTIFAPIFDTIKARIIHFANGQCTSEEMSYDMRLSPALEKCFRLTDSVVMDSFIRVDTGRITSTDDTTIYALIAHCLQPDTLIRILTGSEIRFEYDCGLTRTGEIDTIYLPIPCDCPPCPESECDSIVEVDINCLKDKLADWFEKMPVIRVNDQVLTDGTDFTNPIEIPIPLSEDNLTFTITLPHTFDGGNSEIKIKRKKLVKLKVFEPNKKDTILQLNGDVVLVYSESGSPNLKKINLRRDSIKLWHYIHEERKEEIEQHSPGAFCKEIKDFDFCYSSIRVEWNKELYGNTLISDYRRILQRCREDLMCVDYGTIVVHLGER